MQYDELTYVRNDVVENETNWLWIKGEVGAWDGPVKDWTVSHSIKYFKYLKSTNTVVSAGGNQGLYARLLSKRFKQVYVFEPDPLNFFCLTFNTQFENVFKFQCALGETNKTVSLFRHSKENSGETTVDDRLPGIIPCITIDSLGLTSCDLIQLDIEGYEINAIKGAADTINKFKPVVILENGHLSHCTELMHSLNYKAVDRSVSDTIFIPN